MNREVGDGDAAWRESTDDERRKDRVARLANAGFRVDPDARSNAPRRRGSIEVAHLEVRRLELRWVGVRRRRWRARTGRTELTGRAIRVRRTVAGLVRLTVARLPILRLRRIRL